MISPRRKLSPSFLDDIHDSATNKQTNDPSLLYKWHQYGDFLKSSLKHEHRGFKHVWINYELNQQVKRFQTRDVPVQTSSDSYW